MLKVLLISSSSVIWFLQRAKTTVNACINTHMHLKSSIPCICAHAYTDTSLILTLGTPVRINATFILLYVFLKSDMIMKINP